MPLEDHLIRMKREIEAFKPNRVAIERVSTPRSFREFVIALTAFVKHQEMAGLFTSTTPTLLGGTSVTEAHISTICDSIILLRYVEILGEMRHGLTVLKMRGSPHEKEIREFTIDGNGMHIGKPHSTRLGSNGLRQVLACRRSRPRPQAQRDAPEIGALVVGESTSSR
jgi:circadian clock protein KaiC